MTTWTASLLTALDEVLSSHPAAGAHPVGEQLAWFFRDDDAGWADDRLLSVARVFDGRGLSLDVAAIPTAVSGRLATALRSLTESRSVAVHQHGYAHVNHENAGRRSEFGDTRAIEDQLRDLRSGRERLLGLLEGAVEPFFTPPWNRCADATVSLLGELGIRVLSCDVSARRREVPGVAEIPVTVDWARCSREGGRERLLEELVHTVRWAGRTPIGVMLHHSTMTDGEVASLEELLEALAGHPAVDLTSMRALARAEDGLPFSSGLEAASHG